MEHTSERANDFSIELRVLARYGNALGGLRLLKFLPADPRGPLGSLEVSGYLDGSIPEYTAAPPFACMDYYALHHLQPIDASPLEVSFRRFFSEMPEQGLRSIHFGDFQIAKDRTGYFSSGLS